MSLTFRGRRTKHVRITRNSFSPFAFVAKDNYPIASILRVGNERLLRLAEENKGTRRLVLCIGYARTTIDVHRKAIGTPQLLCIQRSKPPQQ